MMARDTHPSNCVRTSGYDMACFEYTSAARKELRKMGRVNAARILDWMDKHIDGCEDPRVTGKGLTANRSGQWRYRIGDYRVLCLLRDEVVTVEVFRIRHRSEAYK